MDQGQATIAAAGLQALDRLLGSAPVALMSAVDNGYIVIFHPMKTAPAPKKMSPRMGVGVYAPGGYVPGAGPPRGINPDEEKILQEEIERRREVQFHIERSKVRVRVYPALSQAMGEVTKFYEAGGVVPGIDFMKLAEERGMDIGDGMVIGA